MGGISFIERHFPYLILLENHHGIAWVGNLVLERDENDST